MTSYQDEHRLSTKVTFTASPLAQAPSLSSALVTKLREEISSKRLGVGTRFPTDSEIAKAYGVSRTVVREAVSALRAEGLVSTQRGRGSIVAARMPERAFGITQQEINSLEDILRVFELRSALESEAAGLAALRRSSGDVERLESCLVAIDQAIERGEDAFEEDIEFHITIATATQNEYFPRLLGSFRSVFIARRRVRSDLEKPPLLKAYLHAVQAQHRQIVDAIRDKDAAIATAVMRKHLDGSRYRNLQEKAEVGSILR
jgi:DNA-binding FadR family transcriptional regulator